MSVFSPLQRLRYWAAVVLLPALLCACSSDDSNTGLEDSRTLLSHQYINLNITVGTGNGGSMRAPAGGEEGDGREAGFERENLVTGITLMLYEDAAGINTTDETTLSFIKYYPVSLVSRETAGTPYNTKQDEAIYTTGNQSLEGSGLDMSKTYHVIVVANQNMTSTFTTSSKVKDVRDYVMTKIYNSTGLGADASNFVMSLETDYTMNFASPSSKTTEGNKITYFFDNIRIERLAARIDFWTNYSNNTKTAAYGTYNVNVSGTPTTVNGFKYIIDTDGRYFILESITLFNLYNEQEYLFKRVTSGWTGTPTTTYLADETLTNYVVDPHTVDKESSSLKYISQLGTTEPTWASLPFYRTAESLNSQTSKLEISSNLTSADKSNVFVVGYAKENTLLPTTPLKSYATGMAITGSYYTSDNDYIVRKTYCGYLRHQGESSTPYEAYEWSDLDASATVGSTPMKYGIVRNNIYRVSIESISPLAGKLSLKVAVHDWREVTHPQINI